MDLVTAFLHHLAVERNLSPHTVRCYGGYWQAFADFLARGRPDMTPETATKAEIRGFLDEMRQRVIPDTRACALTALRMGYTFAVREGLRPDNPALALLFPKRTKRVPVVPAAEAVAALLDAPWPGTWLGLRDHAVAELLYGCGLRISEAVGLPVEAWDRAQRLVRILGKGRKEGVLPIPGVATRALEAYWLVRPRPDGREPVVLFVGSTGAPLGITGIRRMLQRRARDLHLPYIKPHGLRKAFATHLAENGADVREVQALLRHESLETTRIYFATVETARLARVVARAHPRA